MALKNLPRAGAVRARLLRPVVGVGLLAVFVAFATGVAPARAAPGPVPAFETSGSTTPTVPPAPVWTTIGYSAQERPIQAIRFGSGSNHVLLVAGIHGTEYGCDVARKLSAFLLANPSALPADVRLDIVASANPDGRALRQRGNAHGVDLNRNFPARNWRRITKRGATSGRSPGSEPETQVLMYLLESGGYSRVISLHSRGPLVDYDGPGSWTLARRLARKARMPVVRLANSGHYYGSMGNWVPQHFRIPIVTVELKDRALPYRLRRGLFAAME
jgi:protein MpaA